MSFSKNCFVVQKKITHQVWSVRDTERHRQCIMAFQDERKARFYMKSLSEVPQIAMVSKRAQQPLLVERYDTATLLRRCNFNALDFIFVDTDGNFHRYPSIESPNDNIVFHLENCVQYY